MVPVRIVLGFGISLLFLASAFGESFEGFIGDHPIWMDLTLPAQDGPVQGSYFYKKVGTPIPLKGEKRGDKLKLDEKDTRGKVTGTFACAFQGRGLAGTWGKPGAKKGLAVRLPITDPAYKAHAVHKFTDLKLLEEGTLAESIASFIGDDTSNHIEVDYLYDQRNILSVDIGWSGMGAYPVSGTTHYLFDLKRRKQVSIWDEIDAAGLKRIWKVLGPKLDAELKDHRKAFPDSEWVSALRKPDEEEEGDWEDPGKKLDGIFSVSRTVPAPGLFNAGYLDSTTFHFVSSDWFRFPHVIQAMDVYVGIPMPITELVTYLKPGSFLRNLVREP